jgi:hypothetical protein
MYHRTAMVECDFNCICSEKRVIIIFEACQLEEDEFIPNEFDLKTTVVES